MTGQPTIDNQLAQRFAWFAPDTEILGVETRSLSLRSYEAVGIMGLSILKPEANLTPLEELGEVTAYVWLHSEDPALISRALWEGSWRHLLHYDEPDESAALATLAEWREVRERILFLLDATAIRLKAKPAKPGAKPDPVPSDVVAPSRLAHRIMIALRDSGMSRQEAGWELPIWEANLLYHAAMRWEGQWTVRTAGVETPPESMEDFDLPDWEGGADD
jgi:hypothetical protein